jgi:hypothetical protein
MPKRLTVRATNAKGREGARKNPKKTTVVHPDQYKYPYLLRGLVINRQNQGLVCRHHLGPVQEKIPLPDRDDGLALAQGAHVAPRLHHDGRILRGRPRRGPSLFTARLRSSTPKSRYYTKTDGVGGPIEQFCTLALAARARRDLVGVGGRTLTL